MTALRLLLPHVEGKAFKATATLRMQRYCWVVWHSGYPGPATLR